MSLTLADVPRAKVYGSSGGGGGGGVSVEPLHVDGLHFKRPDGTIWKYRCATGFSLIDDVKHGRIDKARTYLRWLRSLGINTVRVFCTWGNLSLRVDRDATRAALLLLKDEGFYCHLVGLCDQVSGSSVRLPKSEQVDWLRFCIALGREIGNVIFETFNEARKNDDDEVCGLLPSSDYAGVPSTRSWWDENESYTQVGALIDFTTGHTDRGKEWARTFIQTLDVSQRGYGLPNGDQVPATRKPHILGEPRRIAEGSTPRQQADYHAGALLMGPGSCLHGGFRTIDPRHESDLQNCMVPSGASADCCDAVGAVHRANVWPLNTPDGDYVRGGVDNHNNDNKSDCPILHRDRYFGGSPQKPAYEEPEGAARSFFIDMGGKYYGLAVDPGPNWTLKVRSGFRLVAQGGYDGNMLVLERT